LIFFVFSVQIHTESYGFWLDFEKFDQILTLNQVIQPILNLRLLQPNYLLQLWFPRVVSFAGYRSNFPWKLRSALLGELDGVVELEFSQAVSNIDFVGWQVWFNELVVFVLFLELSNASPGQTQKIQNDFLSFQRFAEPSFLELLMNSHPILPILLNELQEQVRFLQSPCMLLNAIDELGYQSIHLLLFIAFVFFLKVRALLIKSLLVPLLLDLLAIFLDSLLLSAAFVFLLTSWLQLVINTDLFEIMMGQEQGEVSLAVAFYTENVLVLFLRKRWVFWVYVFHDVGDLLRIQTSIMLEPNYSTVYPAIIATRSNFSCDLFQQLTLVLLISLFFYFHIQLMRKQLFFAIFSGFEYMGVGLWFECKARVVSIDYSKATEEKMDFHHPISIMAQILSDGIRRKILLICVIWNVLSANYWM